MTDKNSVISLMDYARKRQAPAAGNEEKVFYKGRALPMFTGKIVRFIGKLYGETGETSAIMYVPNHTLEEIAQDATLKGAEKVDAAWKRLEEAAIPFPLDPEVVLGAHVEARMDTDKGPRTYLLKVLGIPDLSDDAKSLADRIGPEANSRHDGFMYGIVLGTK